MKLFLAFIASFFLTVNYSHAAGLNDLTQPIGYAAVSGTISTSAWTPLISGTTYAASGLLIHNGGTSHLILAKGASGSEVATGLLIPPSTTPILVPAKIFAGARYSLKALYTSSSGTVGVTFFQ